MWCGKILWAEHTPAGDSYLQWGDCTELPQWCTQQPTCSDFRVLSLFRRLVYLYLFQMMLTLLMHSAASYFILHFHMTDIIAVATFEIYSTYGFIQMYTCVVLISSLSVDASLTHWDY